MIRIAAASILLPLLSLLAGTAQAELKLVTSIKPLHSLVSAVAGDKATVEVLVSGNASPHGFSLKPSQARAIADADAVFWIGPEFERFLARSLVGLRGGAHAPMIELDDLELLPYRELPSDADTHAHSHADDAAHDASARKDERHERGKIDMHIWLSPANGIVMLDAIAERLAALDPENGDVYKSNAAAWRARIADVDESIAATLASSGDLRYAVFHDAYRYFENRYGLEPTAILTLQAELAPGAKRVRELRQLIRDENVSCVFSEAQFGDQLAMLVSEGSDARVVEIDPLGSGIDEGAALYTELLRRLGNVIAGC
ncbi:MAG: zinc ABC transporter substrate-binding protein [Gammaproteobacteria bacterium]|nr:MAG: zinc ABC transporter substrate-binding protein [Gammaproteobacteria bacterium]